MPRISQLRQQTLHYFDRYRIFHQPLGRTIMLLTFLSSPLQSILFSVSGADDKPLIALGKTFISIASDNETFWVQLVITRNIIFPGVLVNDFPQTHGRVINFPTNQLYLTNPSPKPTDSPINSNQTRNTHITLVHTQHLPSTPTHICPTQSTIPYN